MSFRENWSKGRRWAHGQPVDAELRYPVRPPQSIGDVVKVQRREVADKRARRRLASGPGLPILDSTCRKLIALGHIRALRLYLALQYLHNQLPEGRRPGWLRLDRALLLALSGLIGQSLHTLRVAVRQLAGLCWRLGPDKLFLTAPHKLAERVATLSAAAGVGDPFEHDIRASLPVAALADTPGGLQGAIFDLWLGRYGDAGLTAPWAVLERLWGASRGGLRRWLALSAVAVTPGWGYAPVGPAASARMDKAELSGRLEARDLAHGWQCQYKGMIYLGYQRANSYTGHDRRTSGPGRALKVWRALRRCAGDHAARGANPFDPTCSPVGDSDRTAGQQLSEALDRLEKGGGGTTARLAAFGKLWRRIARDGRTPRPRANYVHSQADKLARAIRRRPQETLYWLSGLHLASGARIWRSLAERR